MEDFDYIIELRNHEDEELIYEHVVRQQFDQNQGFSMFDF
jgi:hypothetical protein